VVYSHVEKQDSLEFFSDLVAGPFQQYSNQQYSSTANRSESANNYMNYKYQVAAKLKKKCWIVIDAAVRKRSEVIFHDHQILFQQRMKRVRVDIPASHTSSDENIQKVMGMYEMGRHLMLTSASKSPANLQGLWADGKKSMWNGDYHLNINMQMMYWAADASGLDETLPPLFTFLDRLSKRGAHTAKNLYNCKGWVAHGFTDHFLDGGMNGELHWSLCVTCGAWLALSLWKHVTYKFDLAVIATRLLPIFRGIATFFLDYFMRTSDGGFFTGPTTSPETSYVTGVGLANLAFTPALDASILRQVANAYRLAVDLLRRYDSKQYLSTSSLDAHHNLANDFHVAVRKLPFQALPVVGYRSKVILEYPMPFSGALTTAKAAQPKGNAFTKTTSGKGKHFSYDNYNPSKTSLSRQLLQENKALASATATTSTYLSVDEIFDPGHRHFSHMHWFYPGLFLPSNQSSDADSGNLYSAVKNTLLMKQQTNAGHTSWSASWLASLLARLGASTAEDAWTAVQSIVNKYTSKRMLSLHPPLNKAEDTPFGACPTCYTENSQNGNEGQVFASTIRSLTTSDGTAVSSFALYQSMRSSFNLTSDWL
jgi:hypothetical protein